MRSSYLGAGAATAAEALGRIRASRAGQAPPVDVMLCDLMLPEMSGVELLVKVRMEAPDTSVIVITAVGDIETALRSMRLGAYDYLIKPVSPADVVMRVSASIEMRREVLQARRAQERLEASHRQLQQLAEVKDSLVQMLVHDLKSPLSSAMGYIQLVEGKGAASFSERQLRYLQRAYTSCKDVLRMSTTMLDVTRMEKGALELHRAPVDLEPLLREAAAEATALVAASGGSVEVECDPAAGAPEADREMVRRILSNLLANAAKYSPPGCRIRIAARPCATTAGGTGILPVTHRRDACATGPDAGGTGFQPVEQRMVLLFVADNGPGIPLEQQQAIFEKYHQLPSHQGMGGAGIGLAFCRMAVEAHGGRIWVESQQGQGSTFCFTLPLHTPFHQAAGEPLVAAKETGDEDDSRRG